MSRRLVPLVLVFAMLLTLLAGCGDTGDKNTSSPAPGTTGGTQSPAPASTPEQSPEPTVKPCNLSVAGADLPQTQFAENEIMSAARKAGVEDAWTVSFDGIDEALEEQGYAISVSGKTISVKGGDAVGLMYGGLEVADEIAMAGSMDGVISSQNAPDMLKRGVKFNAPLDMRTPSYSDAGDSAQNNIESMWDMEFWKAEFDAMARNRMNVFSLWNLNPFPSMVKVPEYPDVALDDVWKTTIPFDSSYNGTATNMVRPEHWENYEVVKTMTIDEKIDFWREVMQYAADRGIEFYVITWSIYTYAENGQYGIDNDPANPTTKDYFRASVREMVKTYPLLAGVGITAGENMDWADGSEEANETWLWETYGQGINDALAEDPDRDITLYHRLHLTEFDTIADIWKDFKGTIDFSIKYSECHMLSYIHPEFYTDTLRVMPEGDMAWLELRCDDSFSYRWGDPDYLRDYLAAVPNQDRLRGFLFGPDNYILGREYAIKDEDLCGQLHIEKNWYFYALMGRLGYDMTLPNEYFEDLMAAHFDEISRTDADKLFDAMAVAGKIIPQVNWLCWMNSDLWYPELCFTEPRTFGFLGIKRWINASNSMPGAPMMSIKDYAQYVKDGQPGTELLTPPEAAANLRQWAEETLKLVSELEAGKPASLTPQQKEFYSTVTDQKSVANLGLYYAEKIEGVLELRQFNDTEDETYRANAVAHLKKALEYWTVYAELYDQQYLSQMYPRLFVDVSPSLLLDEVEADISAAESWKPRRY